MSKTRYKRGDWDAVCSSCGINKPFSEFSKDKHKKSGITSQCKKCRSISNKRWRLENKEHLQRYYIENKETFKRNDRKYKKNNRERLNAAAKRRRVSNPEKHRKLCRDWRKSNLDKDAKRARERRLLVSAQKPKWANEGYLLLFYKLAKIEEDRTGRKVHVDHIIPLKAKKVCGLHCEDNLQLLFAEDNLSKRNKYDVL